MGARPSIRQRALVVVGTIAGLLLLSLASHAGALMLAPALALVALIGLGLFPSETLIRHVRGRLRRRRLAPLPLLGRPVSRDEGQRGAVLSFALATRPPPLGGSPTSA